MDRFGRSRGSNQSSSSPPSTPLIDGRRAFRGQPQLTNYEVGVLARVSSGTPLVVIIERGSPVFYLGKIKIRDATARRLIERQYLRPRDAGLLPDAGLAQTYEVVSYETDRKSS